MKIECRVCPHKLEEGQVALQRKNRKGKVVSENYGKVTAMALDLKKALYHYYPGSKILSVGSYGCNLRCPFAKTMRFPCQK